MNYPLLDIAHYRTIVALTKYPRITDAAEFLGVTPSALSHRIAEAERRLGVQLFVRKHRRLRLSRAGEHIARVGARVLAEMTEGEQDAERMDAGAAFVVRLCVEDYNSYGWFPAFVKHLQSIRSDIGLHLVSPGSARAEALLLSDRADIVIASRGALPDIFECRKLFEDELVFLVPPDHPCADRDVIGGPEAAGQTFITYTRVPAPDREYAKVFRPGHHFPKWTELVEIPEVIVGMVAAGLGITVLSRWACGEAIRAGRVTAVRAGKDGLWATWHSVTRKDASDEAEAVRWTARLLETWWQEAGPAPNA